MPSLPPGWTVAGAAPWEVHRRWVTRLGRETFGRRVGRRFRRSGSNLDLADGVGCVPDLGEILFALVAFVVIVLLAIFVLPVLVIAVEVVLGLVALLLGLVAKVLFRRPWVIDAFAADGTHLRWKEVGWRTATERRDEITRALAHGVIAPGGELLHTDATVAVPPPTAPPPDWDGRTGPFGGGR
ncbi:hypothetical protein HC251_07535 [Iamia sp. SCSIO 61187]|uniref:hypothetical protein n=1 Tax=Iamia sp. SCSIO 61187 TaxID=2722752 RepID=UPI001C6345DD|nr:hypothetical protein [Iamia sp. SCSIO 61187]QYG92304.1 hypothetical protein HC251_07535 [Iamia sp. SCSIO 61187]